MKHVGNPSQLHHHPTNCVTPISPFSQKCIQAVEVVRRPHLLHGFLDLVLLLHRLISRDDSLCT